MPFQTCLSECHQWFSMPWGWENPTLSSGNYHPEKERRTPPWGWNRWQYTVPCRLLCTSSSIKILLIILHCSDKWNAVYCWLQLLIVSPCSTELGLSNIDSAKCKLHERRQRTWYSHQLRPGFGTSQQEGEVKGEAGHPGHLKLPSWARMLDKSLVTMCLAHHHISHNF